MVSKKVNLADLKGKVDFGIITIREDEYEAILQRLPPEQLVSGNQTYAISKLKTANDDEYVIASVRCLEQGNGEGQTVAHTLIDELDPQWILLVGIAGSVPAYEHTLGDVLLATRLHDFSVSASIEDSDGKVSQQFAIKGGPMHPKIQNILAALPAIEQFLGKWNSKESLTVSRPLVKISPRHIYGDEKWRKKVKECLNHYFGRIPIRQHPKAFTGSIASSDTLVKDTQLVQEWTRTARQINGIEMELAGVYQAAWKSVKPVLAIRGISDIVGFRRTPEWTSYACHTAAAFAVALLHYRPIIPHSNPDFPQGGTDERNSPSLPKSQPVGVYKAQPQNVPPIPKKETLYSNLIEVGYFPDKLYSVQTKCKKDGEIWASLRRSMGTPFYDWVYKGKMLYAFHDFSDPAWKDICELDTVESQDTRHWSESIDQDRVNVFIELLGGCLNELAYARDLDYVYKEFVLGKKKKKSFKYLCYAPTSIFSESPLFCADDFQDIARLVGRLKNDDTKLAKYLFAGLSAKTRKLIERYPKTSEDNLTASLVDGFNRLLDKPLYNSGLFYDIYLRKHTLKLLDMGPSTSEEKQQINRMLLEDVYKGELAKRYFAPRVMKVKSLVNAVPREVFGPHFSSITGKFRYYRHNAFRYQFIRLTGKWYMEITPTYHYTNDGYSVFPYYEDEVKGIKRIEDNQAVFRQVIFWSRILKGVKPEPRKENLFRDPEEPVEEYPYLRFGELLEYKIDYGVIDNAWRNKDLVPASKGRSRRRGRADKSAEESKMSTQQPLHFSYDD